MYIASHNCTQRGQVQTDEAVHFRSQLGAVEGSHVVAGGLVAEDVVLGLPGPAPSSTVSGARRSIVHIIHLVHFPVGRCR